MPDSTSSIAARTSLPPRAVGAVIKFLEEGATVPFIARYRKEATGGLDEVGVATVQDALAAHKALEKRRESVLAAISEQGKLDDRLKQRILAASTRQEIEDLYLPFKRKRTTRASKAEALGLGPLAARMLSQPRDGSPQREARRFVRGEVSDVDAALTGARDIAAQSLAEQPELRALARDLLVQHGSLGSKAIKKKTEGQRTAYEDYYDWSGPLRGLASHRYLALCRGEAEAYLRVKLSIDEERLQARLERPARLQPRSPWFYELRDALADGIKRLLLPSLSNEIRADVRAWAEDEAVEVFAKNLQDLLLAAPYGQRAVVGVDPGFRTGCKCAALSPTGAFLAHLTIHPHTTKDTSRAARDLVGLVKRHRAEAVAVGNGTAGRETLDFARRALREAGLDEVIVVSVSESGASIYSASEVARQEFPELDLTVRGAISIGRRLQDPLAELVKVEPKALGVGQYQHDITPSLLEARLARVVERVVNRVGVELNTASPHLLQHVAGLGPTLSQRVVAHRDEHGPFRSRAELKKVKGLGAKTFEQCAGFLRIRDASHPLDRTAVHPERYALVARMAQDLGVPLERLAAEPSLARRIPLRDYASGDVGMPTLQDIVQELVKPGRDPRDAFEAPAFREDVRTLEDLQTGMVLEGVVTNITRFGAFVDIGVHQDGLVHVSRLSDRYVSDPHEVVSVGQRLRVEVLSVDLERQRISLAAV